MMMMGDESEGGTLLVESEEGFAKKVIFKKKIPTMVLKPTFNSDGFWTEIEKGLGQEKTQVGNIVVQTKDSVLTEKQANVFGKILSVQKEVGSLALNFRK